MTTDTAAIMAKLDSIETQLVNLRESLADADLILTEDDRQAIKEANAAFDAGKTTRLA